MKVFILLKTFFILHNLQIPNVFCFIDLKRATNATSLFQYSSSSNQETITSTRIYSTQLEGKFLNQYFRISNKTTLQFVSDRLSLCQHIKHCDKQLDSDSTCLLSLNLIFYLSGLSEQVYLNQLKSVKLNILVNDYGSDILNFDKSIYDFEINAKSLQASNENLFSLGSVVARMLVNVDLNSGVKYYLDFNAENKEELTKLFQINTNTGLLLLNKEHFNPSYLNREFVFYVDAISQCGLMQKSLRNRSSIHVNIFNEGMNATKWEVTHLISTKRLGNSIECLQLAANDLSQTTIALAQVIIEVVNEQDLQSFHLNLVQVGQGFKHQLNATNFKIQHLADNIYVIYMIDFAGYSPYFLNDIYKIQLGFKSSNVTFDIYLCIDTTLYEQFSLIQFSQQVYRLNAPSIHDSNFTIENQLKAASLESPKSQIQFYLHSEALGEPSYEINQYRLDLNTARLDITDLNTASLETEQLQYEVDALAFDPIMISEQDMSPQSLFTNLRQMTIEAKKFSRSLCKILVNKNQQVIVDDSSIESINDNRQIYKFYVKPDSLVKNSIIGYLPNIHDLRFLNELLTFTASKSIVENYYYSLQENNDCFNLHKFDGTLTISKIDCFTDKIIKLNVTLNSMLDNSVHMNYAEIWLVNMLLIQTDMSEVVYREINSNAVNLVYETLSGI